MTEAKVHYGTPSMILLPSAKYKFTVDKNVYSIVIPRSGTYHELDEEFFAEEEGEFNIYNDEGLVDIPAISKVLYATKQYPDLAANQLFAPLYLHIREDSVEIVGQVIDVLQPKEK